MKSAAKSNKRQQMIIARGRTVALVIFLLFITITLSQNISRTVQANTVPDSFVELKVTRNDDRNGICVSGVDCSLREAVASANATTGDERITFAADLTTITLTLGDIVITNHGSLRIEGPGADRLAISGGGASRIFYTDQAAVTISALTLRNGASFISGTGGRLGGAVYVVGGTLVLDRVVVKDNACSSAFQTGGGGGICYNGGVNHLIYGSTFSGNYSGTAGGGIAIIQNANVVVVNSTFSGNEASGGGAISCTSSRVDLRNVTITNNLVHPYQVIPARGGGIYVELSAQMTFGNTIVSNNKAMPFGATVPEDAPDIFSSGTSTSLGHNQVGACPTCAPQDGGIIFAMSDIRGVSPELMPLGMYGGSTPTHGIMRGSPVINRGDNSLAVNPLDGTPLTQDQRGYMRIAGGPTVDIGAFEFRAFPAAVVTGD